MKNNLDILNEYYKLCNNLDTFLILLLGFLQKGTGYNLK